MRVLTVFGTRPEAIKLSPVVKELQSRSQVECFTCVSGQHREMLDQVLRTFDIRPDFDLQVMSPGQELGHLSSKVIEGVGAVVRDVKPDWIIVQGDTTTAFGAALAGFYQKVKIAHVEAGLRTGNIYSPWPEEMNRKLVGQLATLHFPPTEQSARNLRAEGTPEDRIYVTGNTVIDALHWVVERLAKDSQFATSSIGAFRPTPGKKLILVTGHRRENFDGGLERVCQALRRIAERPDVEIAYAVHLNPKVQGVVRQLLSDHSSIHLLEPQDYVPFVALMRDAYLIVTDSGGIQEEAPGLGKPVLVTRETTERPEAIEAGTARLVGTDPAALCAAAEALLSDEASYAAMAKAHNPFGDGKAAQRIVTRLLDA